ncbi:1-(5-phosphoribosyl)-5-amino-4-imidazole-carboxylate carboxylase, partial [Streptomyces sp. T-3]|nr:1-(5-phosphoribosyl)-5-amino-4-imidazole-carboxylate carboxylase [Streptomyces sp. T-3]
MDRDEVRALLRRVASGTETTEEALHALVAGPLSAGTGAAGVEDLGFARLDSHRALRTGDPEVVYGAGKSAAQTLELLEALVRQPGRRPALATRLPDETLDAVSRALPDARIDRLARCVAVGEPVRPTGRV